MNPAAARPLPRAYGEAVLSADFRTMPEDFRVDEIAAFEPFGQGEHLLLTVEKRGMNTAFAAKRIAAWAGIPEMGVGYAGLKDRHAITRQRFSVHIPKRVSPDIAALESDDLRVIEEHWHNRKPSMPQCDQQSRYHPECKGNKGHLIRVETAFDNLSGNAVDSWLGDFKGDAVKHVLSRLIY